MDKKLGDSHRILEFVDGFVWNFGQKLVHYRTGNAGLQAQWLEAWWPSSDNDFAFIVEDDLEVSPLYYKFLRALILNYYYNASNFNPSIYGASLQRPRFVPGKHGNKLQLESETRLFLYQLVGTWGQLLFPRPWKEFRLWYDTHRAKGIKPFLQGMVTTGWYKKMGERIWTPWFIKFIHTRGYFNIYTHFLHERALSISHRDAGVNYGKTAGPDSYLLDKTTLDFNLLETQPLSHLKWFDFCFREVLPGRVIKSLDELGPVLHSVQKHETVVFISLFRASEVVIRNLVCHFERLNIENYIFIGRKSDFLLDLARRGHPVIEADQFVHDIKSKGFRESSVEILVKVHVIKNCLELKYNSWVVDGNLVFNSSDLFLNFVESSYDFYAGNSVELLFVRSSSAVWKIWVDDLLTSKSLLLDPDFMRVVIKLLERDKGVKIKRIDETSIGLKIDGGNVNRTIVMDGKKMVFWSLGMGMELIQKRLEELGMWIIDNDSSCLAVVCHQS